MELNLGDAQTDATPTSFFLAFLGCGLWCNGKYVFFPRACICGVGRINLHAPGFGGLDALQSRPSAGCKAKQGK
jgi:hypothetical protein